MQKYKKMSESGKPGKVAIDPVLVQAKEITAFYSTYLAGSQDIRKSEPYIIPSSAKL
jgi:hypothetical protein